MKNFFALRPLPFALCSLMCLLWFQSCKTQLPITTTTHTTTRDTTIYLTDTIFYQLPADTVKIIEVIEVKSNQATIKPIYKQIGYIGVNAFILNNSLNIKAWLTDSTILIPHADTITIPGAITTTTQTNTVTPAPVKYIPKVYKFAFWFVILQLTAAAFFVAGYFLRFKIKLLKNKK